MVLELIATLVAAKPELIQTIVIVMGIFVVTAFSIVLIILQKYDVPVDFWPIIAGAGAFVILAEIANLSGDENLHFYLIMAALVLFFIVALIKFWTTIRDARDFNK